MFFKKTSSDKRDEEFLSARLQICAVAFETVFHHDWEYAKDMIGTKEGLYLP